MPKPSLPAEALVDLRHRLSALPARSAARRQVIQEVATVYAGSEATVYRASQRRPSPRVVRRVDRGIPKVLPADQLERYCEVIAALKLRTTNNKGRHLSTAEAIRLLEVYGVETPQGFLQAPPTVLKKSTVNYYLHDWGLDWRRLRREPPAVRFQAQHSNELWQFDISPSDLKHLKTPAWIDERRGQPTLMLYSVVDDRSGVAYQEYHCTYGEAVEAALQFLFNAMTSKADPRFPFCGRPVYLYADNGPVMHSQVFQRVMDYLDIDVRPHLPAGQDGRRTTARAKGKVERPFRTVKEVHETLYHFHQPQTEAEANAWLFNYLLRYNERPHRLEPHSRMEDWVQHVPPEGVREMSSWERFCAFAREPETRKVAVDARVSVAGVRYAVDPDLAGETVTLWFGLYDDQLYVEHGDKRYGPYAPIDSPIPLHRYRSFKKTRSQQRAERIEGLAKQLSLSRAALSKYPVGSSTLSSSDTAKQPFVDPDPFHELAFPSALDAKRAIADHLALPLAKLAPEQLAALNTLLEETLAKPRVWDHVRRYLEPFYRR
ncbi:MAG TPA: IS481 family transposase [Candidatus Tectomicrobia bacterium]|nr:IS481 family transposase [Candidatus Tectomicrobia bacterium]